MERRGRTFAWDREGRVVLSELPRLGIVVGNVYAVNGTSKPYFDHERGRIVGDRHAWKRRFIARLGDELAPLVARGVGLVLVGDWNVSRFVEDARGRSDHSLFVTLAGGKFGGRRRR